MKYRTESLLLIALLLSALSASGQTGNLEHTNNFPAQIALARCAYTQAEELCPVINDQQRSADPTKTEPVLAQIPRRIPRRPLPPPRPPMGYPGRGYPRMWTDSGTVRHTAIGTLIGFGLGAALGATANTDKTPGTDVRAAFAVGCLGAMLGAVVGASIPSFDARNHHPRHPWPDGDEEDQLASHANPAKTSSNEPNPAQQASASEPLSQVPTRTPVASGAITP
jgi:hypothetical protein